MSNDNKKKIDVTLILKICFAVFVIINVIWLINKIAGWWGGSDLSEWFGVFANFSEGLLEDCTKQKSCGPISTNATKDQCPDYCDYGSAGVMACDPDHDTGVEKPGDDDAYWKNKNYDAVCFTSTNEAVTCNWAEIENNKSCYNLHKNASCSVPTNREVGKPSGIFGTAWSSFGCIFLWVVLLPSLLAILAGLGTAIKWIYSTWNNKDVKNIAAIEGTSPVDVMEKQYQEVKDEMREQEKLHEETNGEQGHPSNEYIEKMPNKTTDEKKARQNAEAQRKVGREITARSRMSNYLTDKWRELQNPERANQAAQKYASTEMTIINKTINEQKHLDVEEKKKAIEEAKERGPVEIIEK